MMNHLNWNQSRSEGDFGRRGEGGWDGSLNPHPPPPLLTQRFSCGLKQERNEPKIVCANTCRIPLVVGEAWIFFFGSFYNLTFGMLTGTIVKNREMKTLRVKNL